MRLTKKAEKKLLHVYNSYWENYLKGDVTAITKLLDKRYTQVGSAESEVFFSKKDAVGFLTNTIDQVAGKLEMRNRVIEKPEILDDCVLINELCDIYVLVNKEWSFYSRFRSSTLLMEIQEEWKIVHQHTSFPDLRTQQGDNIDIQQMAAENHQLRDAVKRRTVEWKTKIRNWPLKLHLNGFGALLWP